MDAKARPLYQSVLQIDKRFVGTYDQYPAPPYIERLARVQLAAGEKAMALDNLKWSLAILHLVFKEGHPLMGMAESLGDNISH